MQKITNFNNTVINNQIKKVWEAVISGGEIEKGVVPNIILNSWEKCVNNGLDPYKLDEGIIMSETEIKQEIANIKKSDQEFGDITHLIREIAVEMELTFTLFNHEAKFLRILAVPDNIYERHQKGLAIVKDASEQKLGTNAVCLALQENKPIQILGAQHYNSNLHNVNCSAAPLHDQKGKIAGVLNISSFDTKQTIETLGLATALAKIIDNQTFINNILENLTICNNTLNEMIEHLPKGIIYTSCDSSINYNNKILELFKIRKGNNEKIKDELNKIVSDLYKHMNDKELDNKEVILNLDNQKKSYLISTKKIYDSSKKEKGNLIMVEDTNSIIKLHNTLKENKAFYTFDDIVGDNPAFKQVKMTAKRISRTPSAVLIYGESGTGKELFAQAIHNESPRRDKPFVAINCGAIPTELIESELFGYEPGAFTGALRGGKPGKLELASGGTLFLDEIESMPLNVQVKLLRALSTNRISKVGGIKEIPIDVRVISATKKDLLKESKKNQFREDLYFRINVITLKLPPLRERVDDIPVLARYFVERFCEQFGLSDVKVSQEFINTLTSYYWPGNVREFKNVIERAIVFLGKQKELTVENLPEKIVKAHKYKSLKQDLHNLIESSKNNNILDVAEEIIIEKILRQEKGNLTKTAEKLGISRPTLYKKIEKHKKLQAVKKLYNN